jgi:hypothetical protein
MRGSVPANGTSRQTITVAGPSRDSPASCRLNFARPAGQLGARRPWTAPVMNARPTLALRSLQEAPSLACDARPSCSPPAVITRQGMAPVKSSAEARCASILRTISSLNAAQGRQPADKIACRHAQPAQHRFSERDEADGERLASSEGQQAASCLFVRFILDLPPLLQTSFPRGVTSAIVASSLFVRTSSQHSQASLRLAPSCAAVL